MVRDHHPADRDRQNHRRGLRGVSFAQVRQDDRVVAIDADTSFGTLGVRVDPHATGS
jgi:hypothetical protein